MDKDLFKDDGVMGLGVISVKELQVNLYHSLAYCNFDCCIDICNDIDDNIDISTFI